MVDAVELVRKRLLRTAAALASAGVDYAVVGGNAVAAWVATVDRTAVRNTQDVDVLIRRADLPAVTAALAKAGFVHQNVAGVDLFLDGPSATPREAVHVVFAEEFVRPGEPAANPPVSEAIDIGAFRVLSLESLVKIKLTANRRKDQVHVLDLVAVGLVNASWIPRLPPALAERLRILLETPDA